MNQLDALKQYTKVVADSGDFRQLAQYRPQDATTNPSLILKAVQKPEYAPLMKEVLQRHRNEPLDAQMDRLVVRFGCEILQIIPGRVSTEIDARLSFEPRQPVPAGAVKVAVRPEAWHVGPPGHGLNGRLAKFSYLGSVYEYTFETELGPVFVLSSDLGRMLSLGSDVGLQLAGHGVSVVQAA